MLDEFDRLAAHLSEQVAPTGASPFARAAVPWDRVRAFRMFLHAPQDATPASAPQGGIPASAPQGGIPAAAPQDGAPVLQDTAAAPQSDMPSAFHLPAYALPGPPPAAHWGPLRHHPVANRAAARLAHPE